MHCTASNRSSASSKKAFCLCGIMASNGPPLRDIPPLLHHSTTLREMLGCSPTDQAQCVSRWCVTVILSTFKRHLCDLQNGRPGHRFQDRYKRNCRARGRRSWLGQFFQPLIGMVLVAAGIVFCFIPGPGVPLGLVGATLLAERSPTLA